LRTGCDTVLVPAYFLFAKRLNSGCNEFDGFLRSIASRDLKFLSALAVIGNQKFFYLMEQNFAQVVDRFPGPAEHKN